MLRVITHGDYRMAQVIPTMQRLTGPRRARKIVNLWDDINHLKTVDRGIYRMELTMKTFIYLSAALLSGAILASRRGTTPAEGSGTNSPSSSGRPELQYLKAVNSLAPP